MTSIIGPDGTIFDEQAFDHQLLKVKKILKELNKSKTVTKECTEIDLSHVFETLEKQRNDFKKLNNRLAQVSAESTELVVELEEKNSELARANAHSAELMAEIELKNDEIQNLNTSLAHANAQAAELISEIESKNDQLEQAHNKLEHLNKNLEKKVKERTAEIETLMEQKDELITQLGHDLKTPLSPLITLLPLVEKTVENPKSKELIQVAIRASNRIRKLVEKAVTLAQLYSKHFVLKIENISLFHVVNEVISEKEQASKESKIIFINCIPENYIIQADGELLRDLFENLFTNAINFSPNGGAITTNATMHEEKVTISVKDQGIGLNDNQIHCIFNEFYKADESRHDLESCGLGMSICKQIVEKHDGHIWVESEGLGKGSTFFFTLPIRNQKENNENTFQQKSYEDIAKKVDALF